MHLMIMRLLYWKHWVLRFGFRWISPLGPLQLDLGFPVSKKLPGDNSYEIQFGIGNVF